MITCTVGGFIDDALIVDVTGNPLSDGISRILFNQVVKLCLVNLLGGMATPLLASHVDRDVMGCLK